MPFDPQNPIVKRCVLGMEMEGRGEPEQALALFMEAWEEASDDVEKSTAAHYVARHQKSVIDKLKWDEMALAFALKSNDETIKEAFPSLYLNIAKCYEDLDDLSNASKHYDLAFAYTNQLPDNGYGNMIRNGIINAIENVKVKYKG